MLQVSLSEDLQWKTYDYQRNHNSADCVAVISRAPRARMSVHGLALYLSANTPLCVVILLAGRFEELRKYIPQLLEVPYSVLRRLGWRQWQPFLHQVHRRPAELFGTGAVDK